MERPLAVCRLFGKAGIHRFADMAFARPGKVLRMTTLQVAGRYDGAQLHDRSVGFGFHASVLHEHDYAHGHVRCMQYQFS